MPQDLEPLPLERCYSGVDAPTDLEYTSRLERAWSCTLSVEYPSRRVFRFWQPGGGFDRNIFRERAVPAVIDYIHANPVRRGLVAQPTDWEWSSARFWQGWLDVPLRMDHPDDPR